jgi:hypothetical protein
MGRTLNNKIKKETDEFCEAMAVPKLAYGIEIRTVTKTGSRN